MLSVFTAVLAVSWHDGGGRADGGGLQYGMTMLVVTLTTYPPGLGMPGTPGMPGLGLGEACSLRLPSVGLGMGMGMGLGRLCSIPPLSVEVGLGRSCSLRPCPESVPTLPGGTAVQAPLELMQPSAEPTSRQQMLAQVS